MRQKMQNAWMEAIWLGFAILRILVAFFLVGVAIWMVTSASLWYRGDGVLKDYTPMHAGHRYVLDLGSVDLWQDGVYDFSIGALPQREFVPALMLMLPTPFERGEDRSRPNGKVRFTVFDSEGAVVDSSRILSVGNGWSVAYGDDVAFKTSGRLFVPKKNERYRLLVDISATTVPNVGYEAKIVLLGVGWK